MHTAKSPGIYTALQYGAKAQYATIDDIEPLSKTDTKTLQEIVGSMLYYARAVDPTMLTTTSTIFSQQAVPTQVVRAQAVQLLQYAAAYSINVIVYKKSKMHVILQVDASYLSRSKKVVQLQADRVAYFGDADNPTAENSMIHAISSIIDVVVSSAEEAKYGAAFVFAQQGVWLRKHYCCLGTPTTTNTNIVRQLICHRSCHRYHQAENVQVHRHALPLAPRQNPAKSIYYNTPHRQAEPR
jgi:hypothetical protein